MSPDPLPRNETGVSRDLDHDLTHANIGARGRRLDGQYSAPHPRRESADGPFGEAFAAVGEECTWAAGFQILRVNLVHFQAHLQPRDIPEHEDRTGANVIEFSGVKATEQDRSPNGGEHATSGQSSLGQCQACPRCRHAREGAFALLCTSAALDCQATSLCPVGTRRFRTSLVGRALRLAVGHRFGCIQASRARCGRTSQLASHRGRIGLGLGLA